MLGPGRTTMIVRAAVFVAIFANAIPSRAGVHVGEAAPPFALPSLLGKEHHSEDFRGKPLILVIGTSTQAAEACREWMLALERNFRGAPVQVYQVIVLDTGWYVPKVMVTNRIKAFVPEHGHELVLLEWKRKFRDDFGIPYDHVPRVVVLDRDGVVQTATKGAMTDTALLQVMSLAESLAQ